MNHSEMVMKLAKSGEAIYASMTPQKLHVWHMASCLMGEAGEVLANDGAGNLKEELGDLEFYLSGLNSGLLIMLKAEHGLTEEECYFDPYIGLTIATCNIFDVCKKWFIYEKELDRDKLRLHIARYEFYRDVILQENKLTLQEILQANMDKLAKRYGADFTYTNKAAQERADKQIKISINSSVFHVPENAVYMYEELVQMAGLSGNPSTTVSRKDKSKAGLLLYHGKNYTPEEGDHITMVHTNNA